MYSFVCRVPGSLLWYKYQELDRFSETLLDLEVAKPHAGTCSPETLAADSRDLILRGEYTGLGGLSLLEDWASPEVGGEE